MRIGIWAALGAWLAACGGKAIIDGESLGQGGDGAGGADTTSSASSSSSSSSSGAGGTMAGLPTDPTWVKALPGVIVTRIAANAQDEPVVVGWVDGYGDVGGTQIVCDDCAVVAQYDAAGNLRWSQRLDFASTFLVQGLEVDAGGAVYLATGFANTISIDDVTIGTQFGSADFAVLKLTATGELAWHRTATSSPAWYNQIESLDVAPNGDNAIAGSTDAGASVGGAPLEGTSPVPFVARYDGDGTHELSRKLPDGFEPGAVTLAGETTYVAGWSDGTLVLEGQALSPGAPAVLEVLQPSGFAVTFVDPSGNARIRSLHVGEDGALRAGGVLYGAVTVGGETLATPGADAPRVFAAEHGGSSPWAQLYGEPPCDCASYNTIWGPRGRALAYRQGIKGEPGTHNLLRVDAPSAASEWKQGYPDMDLWLARVAAGSGPWMFAAGASSSSIELPGGLSASDYFLAKFQAP